MKPIQMILDDRTTHPAHGAVCLILYCYPGEIPAILKELELGYLAADAILYDAASVNLGRWDAETLQWEAWVDQEMISESLARPGSVFYYLPLRAIAHSVLADLLSHHKGKTRERIAI